MSAAVELFASLDYEKVAVADIAANAGVAHGLLFHHFGNKRGIYLEAMSSTAAHMISAFELDPDLEPAVSIRAALTTHVEYLAEHRGLALRLVLGGRGADPEAWAVFEQARDQVVRAIAVRLGLDPDNMALRFASKAAVRAVDEGTAQWLELDVDVSTELIVEWLIAVAVACVRTASILDPSLEVGDSLDTLAKPPRQLSADDRSMRRTMPEGSKSLPE
ncbi:TetR family transcriptional regulator [Rhodococcus sp. 05-340-1]|nr:MULTISPECIES: TetR/AcrR family transcriptional regulator [Rhodococcus]OZD65326.1 TetR family transcriptional regulator [Rhodococcus sp. 05-340-2]OZD74627.1 TetR family transcriptional regulator [Rhodococcus sp. 05-340-1]OZC87692.1 TetR family transcriptional regulator [Rhodococcus sp. 06-412-2C]OZC96343.1 TetR family transcriptional regulator [Rhodococcus sp. 06-412-2B]OZD86599.1 TetR family transcriptional regulator [Rhodococcus sp. 05-339-2]